ncbi:MAG: SatD family protein [Verrucomicrobiota bacterium]
MRHLVVIGDIVSSKSIANRARFQRQLASTLDALSGGNPSLVSPYTLTLGDEFQAVYGGADGLFADLCRLKLACLPVRVRLSLAVGKISTAINPDQALGMDGPAFHTARAGIDALKASEGEFALAGPLPGDAATRDALIELVCANLETWKPNRWAILAGLLAGASVSELARENRITEVAVYKNIRHARLDALVPILKKQELAIGKLLA